MYVYIISYSTEGHASCTVTCHNKSYHGSTCACKCACVCVCICIIFINVRSKCISILYYIK